MTKEKREMMREKRDKTRHKKTEGIREEGGEG